jgi:hypothetical protein
VALAAAGVFLTLLVHGELASGDLASNLGEALAGAYYACLGVLVVRRAGNVIGWLLLGEGFTLAAEDVANAYAIHALKGDGRLPGAELVRLFAE